ncbi:hypothetical protein CCAX7_65260 [Capsulimonas corticalis]|uniref:Uncharacterized protein n=1 Tax=Capsulimonas corticalis TaxID=2219043 RepID=A0A402CR15_9BACT|nr:DUF1802 family protein [Capsulimonas corticalis]BDI34475.1 hypothetical protein CCAX7_65260 [Capsulimonas corticalis]
MLPETLTTALKEWAVVQRSLLEGHQLMLLRKGGIIEETGDFDLKANHFLIYPNYAHETERLGDLQPCFGEWLREEEERRPSTGFVRIEAAAEVTDVIRVDDREKMIKLAPQHIWSRQFIDGRYDWEPYKPIFLLLLRAYALPKAHVLPILPDYGGCRSWIEIVEPISTVGAAPAVSDERFERRRTLTRKLLED